MWIGLFASLALASDGEALLERLDALAPHRTHRAADGAPPISEAEYSRIAAGETVTGVLAVEGHAAKKAYGAAILPHGIDRMWAAINDELNHPGYTSISYSELVAGAPCKSGRRVMQYLPIGVPFVSDRWWVTHLSANDAISKASGGALRELAWTSSVDPAQITSEAGRAHVADGAPIAFTRGAWLLAAVDDGHTLVEYYVWTDPGGSLPAGAASSFAASSIAKTLDAMDRYAREDRSRCFR